MGWVVLAEKGVMLAQLLVVRQVMLAEGCVMSDTSLSRDLLTQGCVVTNLLSCYVLMANAVLYASLSNASLSNTCLSSLSSDLLTQG
jgi:hypothetical protein